MRELISAAWGVLDVWRRLTLGLILVGAFINLSVLIADPSWANVTYFVAYVLMFLTVTALMVLLELYKEFHFREILSKPLTKLGADVMEGIAASENRSALVHIVGDSYMIEPVGVPNEHE